MRTLAILILACAALLPVRADDRDKKDRDGNREQREKEIERQLKNLSPEDRETKRKEIKTRLEKRIRELREKLSRGQLSPDEQRELARREQIMKRFEEHAAGTNAPSGPAPKLNDPSR